VTPAFAGAVLAGGASSRMGTDKALLVVDGHPLAVTATRALEGAGAAAVQVIGGDRAGLHSLELDARPDDHPGAGPLGGIITALRLAEWDPVMILACDMPAVDATVVAAVLEALHARPDADVAVAVIDGRRQILTAAYRRRALHRLSEAFDAGERAPRRAVERLRVVEVDGLDPDRLADVDRPSDLRRYAQPEA
jgi:molybdopterin-guanine dinucleotide biosynthesis protein A